MPVRHAALCLIFLAATAGCIENMGDLKEALGATNTPPPPVYLPPVAKVHAPPGALTVGEPVQLGSSASRDPQGLHLLHAWDLGDGTRASGPTITHAYAAPGDYTIRLTVTNAAGLADDDTVTVRIHALDRAPTVAIRITDSAGIATARSAIHTPLQFDAVASDPEGAPLAYAWDFGDGTTSADPRPTHTYATPGRYDVRVTVTDASGQSATDATRLAIDGAWRYQGTSELVSDAPPKISIPVGRDATSLTLTLTFPMGIGLNDLEIVLLDAAGDEVARTSGESAPASTAEAERVIELGRGALTDAAPGEWPVRIVREGGASVAWTLDVGLAV